MGDLLRVKDLRTYFYTEKGIVKSVDGVSFSIKRGETVGIVGESGCGKSIIAMSILRLVDRPGKIVGGMIEYDGKNIISLKQSQIREIRGKEISMIFQEPITSLNPIFRIGEQISESILFHENVSKSDVKKRVIEMLKLVGIPRAELIVDDYPHRLSGGMRQRVMIAMALSCNPKLLIADEPTTSLDVTIQAQILSLMNGLKKKTNTSIMLITHDLGVVAQMADFIIVMYSGQIVESAPVKELFKNPRHPYTQGLLAAVPSLEEDKKRLSTIEGVVPNLINLPEGCYFASRCKHCMDICIKKHPELYELPENHNSRCFLCTNLEGKT